MSGLPHRAPQPGAASLGRRRLGALAVAWAAVGAGLALASTGLRAEGAPRPEVAALPGVQASATARFRTWGFDVYDVRLWTRSSFEMAAYTQHAFALELQYLRAFEGQAMAAVSLKEMRRLSAVPDAQAQRWQAHLSALLPNVVAGDRITAIHLPGTGIDFWVNGQRAGGVKDAEFARVFLAIWLDERTPQPKLRQQLIKGLAP